MIIYRTMFTLL